MPKAVFTSLLAPHTRVTEEQLATEEGILAFSKNLRALNRRRFLSTLAAAGALAGTAGVFGREAQAQTASTPPINDVLNFALNFEFLEAEFYSYGFNGKSLAANVAASATAGSGNPIQPTVPTLTASNVMNPPQVTLTGNQLAVVQALLQDEAHHIALLQTTISANGGTPITEATIDYSAGGAMPAVTTNIAFFAATRQFTAVGNSAYAGAAVDLIGNTNILTAAAQILGAEAQHIGVVNYLCAMLGILPSSAGGPDKQVDAQDVPPNGTGAIFTVTPIPSPVTASAPPASGIVRTPQQVLGVVYGVSTSMTTTPQTGITKGGFFPNGVLGNITST